MEVSGKIRNSLELSFSYQTQALRGFWKRPEELRNLWNIPEKNILSYIWHMISKLFPDYSGACIYK